MIIHITTPQAIGIGNLGINKNENAKMIISSTKRGQMLLFLVIVYSVCWNFFLGRLTPTY